MNDSVIDRIARAVLYEGYILYPYRRGTKNHHRWTFGGLFPPEYCRSVGGSEPFEARTQCLIRGDQNTRLSVEVRFLQVIDRKVQDASGRFVNQIEAAGKRYQSWQEAIERSVRIEDAQLTTTTREIPFQFNAHHTDEPLLDDEGQIIGTLIRNQAYLHGVVTISVETKSPVIFMLTISVQNRTPLHESAKSMTREMAAILSMASTHVAFIATNGQFISSIDPPPGLKQFSRQCKNTGMWPVLVGEPGQTDTMLAAPIILYDYPEVAPESPGDLFDGTEIDEILSLRILTLTDEEKRQAASLDDRGAEMLRRTESLAREQLMRLHGTMRPPRRIEALHIGQSELHVGDHIRLNPRGGADAFDVLLKGKTATIAAIEQDYENRLHVAVTIDDDPGADIGGAGKIGHRFFFRPDEIEPLNAAEGAPR